MKSPRNILITLIGILITAIVGLFGLLVGTTTEGRLNIHLAHGVDPHVYVEEQGLEFISYNDRLHILTAQGEISHNFVSLMTSTETVSQDIIVETQEEPNDSYWASLWGMRRITAEGQSYDVTKGSEDVVGIVVDTGVDSNHVDIPEATCVKSYVPSEGCVDGHGHGTHVAGTIAGAVNNARGVAGVVDGQIVEIWGYKVLADSGAGYSSWIAQGITDAADRCEDLGKRCALNMSLGGNTGGNPDPTMDAAVNYAVDKGVIVISAAANSSLPYCFAPAISENSMCVGAIGQDGLRANFSNYGKGLDLVAPGVDIWSTVPGGYTEFSGTSMAAPHVTGAALAILSLHTDWSVAQVRSQLVGTADSPPVDPDPSNEYGAGTVNVYSSVIGEPQPTPTPDPNAPTNTPKPPATKTTMPYPPPTGEPTETPERRSYDYSDTLFPGPVVRMDRTEGGATLGNSVDTEEEAAANENDDGAKVRTFSGDSVPLEGAEVRSGRRILHFFMKQDGVVNTVWLRACLARPDGTITQEFFAPRWSATWFVYNVAVPDPGDYAMRVMVGSTRGTPVECEENGTLGEVSDYFFRVIDQETNPTPTKRPTLTPSITPTMTPVLPEDFWIHCVPIEDEYSCKVESP